MIFLDFIVFKKASLALQRNGAKNRNLNSAEPGLQRNCENKTEELKMKEMCLLVTVN